MSQAPDKLHDTVRDYYAERARNTDSCCSSAQCCKTKNVIYPEDLLADVPEDIADFSLGCGDPITLACLEAGQTVLDLGSGGGLDCFLAAKKVGPTGQIIGIDMTPEMIEKARASADRLRLENVEFRHGTLEALPVKENTVDVIISNCVINLAPDKHEVLTEAFRVLTPGGKLAISDIVTQGPLPKEIKESLAAWAECVAGALDINEYTAVLEEVGFTNIEIIPVYFDPETVNEAVTEPERSIDPDTIPQEMLTKTVFSARISAYKPEE
ncbi:MAG: arsenite methyltransferase [Anaerolineales bacterium]|nr:arsenite methyltransferase [Anaerolineales bacterium]